MSNFKFIDLFAGIGGFHQALHSLGGTCVFACEIDAHARRTYQANFQAVAPNLFKIHPQGKKNEVTLFEQRNFAEDVAKVDLAKVPAYDVLCAGFPCQPFSQAGYKRGFQDPKDNRGNMFFSILEFLKAHRPKAYFLENVRHLIRHDEGRTLETIRTQLTALGYSFAYKVVKASDHGLPQHRPRVFIIGFRDDILARENYQFAEPKELTTFMSDIFGEPCNKSIGYTLRVGGKSSGINDRRNWDTYAVAGGIRKITSVEGRKMNGFPDDFSFPVSETQAMKQLGNSVAVPAIRATALQILKVLINDDRAKESQQRRVE